MQRALNPKWRIHSQWEKLLTAPPFMNGCTIAKAISCCFSPRALKFASRAVHMEVEVDKVADCRLQIII
jgi:hypothetical protein